MIGPLDRRPIYSLFYHSAIRKKYRSNGQFATPTEPILIENHIVIHNWNN